MKKIDLAAIKGGAARLTVHGKNFTAALSPRSTS